MRITVSRIPENGIEKRLKFPVDLPDDNIEVIISIQRFGDRVLIEGKADSKLSLTCSRCLKMFSSPVNFSFETEFIPVKEIEMNVEHELSNEELDVSYYRDDEIDIEDLINGHVLLAAPMKPLCRPDCRGICKICGVNLNETVCDCVTEKIDPRLAPLEKIKDKMIKERSENG